MAAREDAIDVGAVDVWGYFTATVRFLCNQKPNLHSEIVWLQGLLETHGVYESSDPSNTWRKASLSAIGHSWVTHMLNLKVVKTSHWNDPTFRVRSVWMMFGQHVEIEIGRKTTNGRQCFTRCSTSDKLIVSNVSINKTAVNWKCPHPVHLPFWTSKGNRAECTFAYDPAGDCQNIEKNANHRPKDKFELWWHWIWSNGSFGVGHSLKMVWNGQQKRREVQDAPRRMATPRTINFFNNRGRFYCEFCMGGLAKLG